MSGRAHGSYPGSCPGAASFSVISIPKGTSWAKMAAVTPTIACLLQADGRGESETFLTLRRLPGSFIQCIISYNLITYPHLTTKEATKCSLLMAAMGPGQYQGSIPKYSGECIDR